MKSNQLKVTLSIFSMLLCMNVYSQRQGGGPPGGDRQGGNQRGKTPDATTILKKLDTNNDGVIDKDEAANDERRVIFDNFAEIDTNENGEIDLDELRASLKNGKRKKPSAKKTIKRIDDNGDGTLSKLEVAAKDDRRLLKNFDTIDSNNDKELDAKELKAFYAKNEKQRKKRPRRN